MTREGKSPANAPARRFPLRLRDLLAPTLLELARRTRQAPAQAPDESLAPSPETQAVKA